jgi:hypothetical protein
VSGLREELAAIELAAQITLVRIIIIINNIRIIISLIVLLESSFTFFVQTFPNRVNRREKLMPTWEWRSEKK